MMSGRLAAVFVLLPNFLPNGRSQTTASTLAHGRGMTANAQRKDGPARREVNTQHQGPPSPPTH